MRRSSRGEEERNKAVAAFLGAHPDWDIVSNQTRCPKCARQHKHSRIGLNFCREHRWASRKWLSGIGVWMLSIRDYKLREELEKAGIR